MRGQPHSEETKAKVCAELLSGAGNSEIARRYAIPESSVRNWKREMEATRRNQLLVETGPAGNDSLSDDEFGDLLRHYLKRTLIALAKQSDLFADRPWLEAQDAQSLALLHSVLFNKALSLLESAERARERDERLSVWDLARSGDADVPLGLAAPALDSIGAGTGDLR